MKKILLGTTAVVALGTMSAEAFAADKISLGLGGFMRQYVGVTDSDEVAATATNTNPTRGTDLAQWANTEVYFTGSTTLDNGLTVAARIEMEADGGASDNIDRSFLTVSSDALGALTAGVTNHAGDQFRVAAPNASNFDWGDFNNWSNVARTAAGATATTGLSSSSDITNFGDDTIKLKYVSPTFADMVTVFASYSAAEGAGETHDGRNLTRGTNGTNNDGYSFGASLSGEFSGASVEAALIHFSDQGAGQEQNQIGLSVGMAGFTVGGSYGDFSDTRTGRNDQDGDAWDLGIGYETGPYALTARYMSANSTGVATTTAATIGDNEDTQWAIDATYDMGAGVKLAASYYNSEFDPEGTTASTNSADVSGIIAGIEVGF